MITGSSCCELLSRRKATVTVETKPTGMVELMLPGRLGDSAGAAWKALEVLSEGRLMDQMNKFTLLDNAVRGFEGAAVGGGSGEAACWRRDGESPDGWRCGVGSTNGELRAIVVLDEGSTQAGARNKMRNNDLRLGFGHASAALRSAS